MNSSNLILYGPPGTGKTYRTSSLSLRLIEGLSSDELATAHPTRAAEQAAVAHYRSEGRLAFVVFHPSFAYEDFVEGIKPRSNERGELHYEVADGIFKQLSVRAAHALYRAQQQNVLAAEPPTRHDFDALFYEFVDYLQRTMADESEEVVFESKTGKPFYLTDINKNSTLSLRMGEGKKAYAVTKGMLAKLYREFATAEEIENLRRDLPAAVRSVGSVAWAVFSRFKHYEATRNQTYRYLLAGSADEDAAHYRAMKRDVQQLDYPSLTPDDYATAGNFVLVIDEINRGNVAALFGELIALLEDGKRAGQPEALATVLPYSRETFSVPPNLYLIGTMNTADRSVESLDTALRRRFAFTAVLPNPALLRPVTVRWSTANLSSDAELSTAAEPTLTYRSSDEAKSDAATIDLSALLKTINRRLVALRDADHQIGHGYLMSVAEADNALGELRKVFYQQLIPLLQEYFFGEADKVMLVIGSNFFEEDRPEATSSFFAPRPSHDAWADELSPPPRYRVRSLVGAPLVKAVQAIYEEY